MEGHRRGEMEWGGTCGIWGTGADGAWGHEKIGGICEVWGTRTSGECRDSAAGNGNRRDMGRPQKDAWDVGGREKTWC